MNKLLSLAAATLALGVLSCTSPVAAIHTSTVTGSAGSTVGAKQARLVFHFTSPSRAAGPVNYGSYTVNDASYLVVQLRNPSSPSSTQFASAPIVGGSASVTFTGLAAASWSLTANLYDWDGTTGTPWAGSPTPALPLLLYNGSDQVQVAPGTSTNVNLLLYQPGDIGSISVAAASLADSLTVVDNQAVPQTVGHVQVGQTVALSAFVTSGGSNVNVEQRANWSADMTSVADLTAPLPSTGSNTATFRALKVGFTTITASSTENAKTGGKVLGVYNLWVEPPVYGTWKLHDYFMGTSVVPSAATGGDSYLQVWRDSSGTLRWTRTAGVGAMTPAYSVSLGWATTSKFRGQVAELADGTFRFAFDDYLDLTAGSPTFGQWVSYTAAGNANPLPSPMTVSVAGATLSQPDPSYSYYVYNFDRLSAPLSPAASLSAIAGALTTPAVGSTDTLTTSVVPGNATIADVVWGTNDPATATVAPGPSGQATVSYLLGATTATVTAVSLDDPTLTASWSVSVSLVAPQLTIGSDTATSLPLSWTAVAGATGYDLDRDTDPLFSNPVNLVVNGATWGYSDDNKSSATPPAPGTVYYYRVRSDAGAATSPWRYRMAATLDTSGPNAVPVLQTFPVPAGFAVSFPAPNDLLSIYSAQTPNSWVGSSATFWMDGGLTYVVWDPSAQNDSLFAIATYDSNGTRLSYRVHTDRYVSSITTDSALGDINIAAQAGTTAVGWQTLYPNLTP